MDWAGATRNLGAMVIQGDQSVIAQATPKVVPFSKRNRRPLVFALLACSRITR